MHAAAGKTRRNHILRRAAAAGQQTAKAGCNPADTSAHSRKATARPRCSVPGHQLLRRCAEKNYAQRPVSSQLRYARNPHSQGQGETAMMHGPRARQKATHKETSKQAAMSSREPPNKAAAQVLAKPAAAHAADGRAETCKAMRATSSVHNPQHLQASQTTSMPA